MWYEKLIEGLEAPQIINDSKTPSGRVHVGSLRGVLIHDAIYRALKEKGNDATYIFGIDDYDPLDGLPADATDELKSYMGQPLCNIPPPPGSTASDIADHYISEFLDIFGELGVGANVYRMRDVYREGRFNEAIDIILSNADKVRKVYAEVSKSERPANWHPFQAVCENCGKIGTTEVSAYDGKEVTYTCRTDMVSWAKGCGHTGKVSPFDGLGKLPWKLEWVAKWHSLGITIEGAGKDHCTKGGSRDVAAACLREIFGKQAPLNVPYEFFLVSGAKMSSSKGIGTAAREMANFLPPEILRFLMIRTPPKRTVNFSTDFEYIVKLFNEHDRLLDSKRAGKTNTEQEQMMRTISVNSQLEEYRAIGFQLLSALLQLPHIDVEEEVEKRTDGGLTDLERENLQHRVKAARYWLEHYASDDDRIELQTDLPTSVADLNNTQKAFLKRLGEHFPEQKLSEEGYQKYIFDIARTTPIKQPQAFAAIYCVLLDKERGPKGGSLLSYLERTFLIDRFNEIDYSIDELWNDTALTLAELETWLEEQKEKLATHIDTFVEGFGNEIVFTMKDNKEHLIRIKANESENGLAAALKKYF